MFKDFVTIITPQVPKDRQTKFIDSVLKDMHANDGNPEEVRGLEARIVASHSSRLTSHSHLYTPAKMKKGAPSFTANFNKPILVNHDMDTDPIGRVKSASYVPTPHPMIPASILAEANKDSVHSKKTLSYLKKLEPFMLDSQWRGLGYLDLVGLITDENAIPKVVDGRYKTVSVSYDTNTLHCSRCFQDWVAEGPCEHKKGQVYDGVPMYIIFGDLLYDEVSYVNGPADEMAQSEEIRRVVVNVMHDFKQNANKLKTGKDKTKLAGFVKNALAQDSSFITNPERVAASDMSLYCYDSKSKLYTSILSGVDSINNHGEPMDLKTFLSLGIDSYEQLTPLILGDKALVKEDLEKLEDKDFVGPNKTFPVIDKEHIDACRTKLAEFEDSDEKTELITFLDTRESLLVKTEDAADAEVVPVVETSDSISYSFRLSADGGNWMSPESQDPKTEMALLNLLMSIYAADTTSGDAVDSILANEKVKDTLVDSLSKKHNLFTDKDGEISSLQTSLTNSRKEYDILKAADKTRENTINELTTELKDMLVEKILTFQSKESPTEGLDEKRTKLKDKTVSELKTSIEVLNSIIGKDTSLPKEIADPTQKLEKTYTQEEFKLLKDNINKKAIDLKSKYGDAASSNFLAIQTKHLANYASKLADAPGTN